MFTKHQDSIILLREKKKHLISYGVGEGCVRNACKSRASHTKGRKMSLLSMLSNRLMPFLVTLK